MVKCKNSNNILAHYEVGEKNVSAIIKKDNITGFQFHPENSGLEGLTFLENFVMNKKILIIGFGAIAQRHITNLIKLYPNYKYAVLSRSKIKKKNIISFVSLKRGN